MAPLEMRITGNGMANIAKSKIENDFEFIVGDRHYDCPWFVADFVSPVVGRLHSFDPSVHEFSIDIEDPEEHMGKFLALGFGSTLELCEGNFPIYRTICRVLGNQEVYKMLIDRFEVTVTIANVFARLHDCDFFSLSPQPLIEFAASHFFELTSSTSLDLPLRTFVEILSHPSLQLATEDSLYDIISLRFEVDAEYVALIEYMRIEYLSADRISALIHWLSNHFDQFNLGVWTSLSNRLKCQPAGLAPNPRVKCRGVLHELKRDSPFQGIIASLTHRYGGNVDDRGIVTVSGTADRGCNTQYAAKNAVDFSTTNGFYSGNESNDQSICYNFNNRLVRPTHYSVNSFQSHYLRSWVVEGSIDSVRWIELDRHEGDPLMNSSHQIGTFALPVHQEAYYQFIRLRQTSKNAAGYGYLGITALELFGYLIE
jgi:hypothetical protein